MQKITSKIINFYYRHKALSIIVLAVLIGAVIFAHPDIAHAAEDTEDPGKLLRDINLLFAQLMRWSAAIMWPVILMIGSLLDNDLIFGGAMGEKLNEVWVQIRNLVNIAFVLILLAIAVYNVLPIKEEGGLPLAFKTAMPKFLLGLIAVNFSFLAVKVILDFGNVLTGAVFALPHTAGIEESYDLEAKVASVICNTSSKEVPMKPLWCKDKELNDKAKNFFSRLDRSNITIAYAVNFGKAVNLKFIKSDIKDITQLGFNIIFNVTLSVIYAASFVALFLVLLMRIVVLWIVVVLSPLMALTIVLPNLKELGGEGGNFGEKFLNEVIAPIKIGLVLSVGYIMLAAFEADKSRGGTILSSSPLDAVDPNALATDITDLQQLMIAAGMVVILWKGVFDAADKTAAKFITSKINDYGKEFGSWVAKLPTYAQIIPIRGGTETASLAQIFDKLRGDRQKFTDSHGRWSDYRPNEQERQALDLASRGDMENLGKLFKNNPELYKSNHGAEALARAIEGKDKDAARDIRAGRGGDGGEVVEAVEKAKGVDVFKKAYGGAWNVGDVKRAAKDAKKPEEREPEKKPELGTPAGAAKAINEGKLSEADLKSTPLLQSIKAEAYTSYKTEVQFEDLLLEALITTPDPKNNNEPLFNSADSRTAAHQLVAQLEPLKDSADKTAILKIVEDARKKLPSSVVDKAAEVIRNPEIKAEALRKNPTTGAK